MNRITTFIAAFLISFFMGGFASAQDITGSVTDSLSTQPLPQASVALLQQDQPVATTTTDNKGNFRFKDRSAGAYTLKIAYIGYKTITLTGVQPGSQYLTRLVLDQKDLKVVTVTASKPFIVQKVDKMIVNIAGSPIAAGGTAWEVLLRAPGVVEQGSSLQLKGKKIVVLIDGRYSNLSGEDLKNMLSAMTANGIDRIELISNPSAKYEAQGGAIINIIMAKNAKLGTNGTATLSGRTGAYGSFNTGLTLNHRSKKLNVYGGYDYLNNQQYSKSNFTRYLNEGKQIADETEGNSLLRNHSVKLGLDYEINKKNVFGVLVKGTANNIDKRNDTRSLADYAGTKQDSFSTVTAAGSVRYLIPSVNLYYKTILDSAGRELRFNADYFSYDKKWNDHFTTRYFNPLGQEYAVKGLQANAPANNDIKSFAVDYTQPITKGSFEAGAKVSAATTDNDALWQKDDNGTWVKDFGKTNHFIYQENVYAAYANVNRQFKKFSLMLGVRAEQTHTEGNSVTTQHVNTNNYLNFFPNARIQYQASENNLFAFSYRKSIERYKYDIVNPFIIYKSQYSYSQGNPYLKPGTQHNFELSYSWNNELFTALTYVRYEDVLADIYRKDSASPAVISTYDNLNSADYYEANIAHSKAFFNNKWIANNSLVISYAKFNAPAGSGLNNAQVTAFISSDHTILLPKGFKVQVSGMYFSPMALGVVTYKSRFNSSVGASKTMLQGKGTLTVNVSDPFNTFNSRFTVSSFGVQSVNYAKPETRFVKATFTYRFGNKNVKASANRKNAIDSESRRMQ